MFKLTDFLNKPVAAKVPIVKKEEIVATNYGKEPVIIVEKTKVGILVGDKVKITPFYLTNYCGMGPYTNQEAEVVKIESRQVSINTIEKGDRAMYQAVYGDQNRYNIICLWIRYPNDNAQYMVSPFGYEKVK